jgi:hypothetical protein
VLKYISSDSARQMPENVLISAQKFSLSLTFIK